jgi:hypothetical protein
MLSPRRWLIGLALALAVALPVSGRAQTPAPNQTLAADVHAPQPWAAPARHVHHHPRRHSHVTRHHAAPPPAQRTESETRAPTPPAYSEAPTPDSNLLPPHEYIPPDTSVVPGTLQLHYPPSGNGYVTGSSPQALDDDRTAKVPGLTLHVPLQPGAPPPMPPPEDPLH